MTPVKHVEEKGRMKYPAPHPRANWNSSNLGNFCARKPWLVLFFHLHCSKLKYSRTVFQFQDRLGCSPLKAGVYARQYVWDEPSSAVIIDVNPNYRREYWSATPPAMADLSPGQRLQGFFLACSVLCQFRLTQGSLPVLCNLYCTASLLFGICGFGHW